MRPGATVKVAILAKTVPDAILIPLSAIRSSRESGEEMVLIAGADSKAHERKIKTGIREGDKAQVLKGLSPGEQVITTGGHGVEDKSAIKVENGEAGKKEAGKAEDKEKE